MCVGSLPNNTVRALTQSGSLVRLLRSLRLLRLAQRGPFLLWWGNLFLCLKYSHVSEARQYTLRLKLSMAIYISIKMGNLSLQSTAIYLKHGSQCIFLLWWGNLFLRLKYSHVSEAQQYILSTAIYIFLLQWEIYLYVFKVQPSICSQYIFLFGGEISFYIKIIFFTQPH